MKTGLKLVLMGLAAWSLQGCVPAIIAGGAGAAVGANSAGSGLSMQTQVDDAAIKSQAMNIINHIPDIQYRSNIEVVVFNRQVLLLGQVPSEHVKNEVADKIARIDKVKVVFNHLKIEASNGIKQYSEDSWITTKVKANFVGKVNPFHFKVVTEDGVVYLLGITTKAEGQKAAEIASKTSGVKKVVKDFTYVKPEPKKTESKNTPDDNSNQQSQYEQQDLTHVRN